MRIEMKEGKVNATCMLAANVTELSATICAFSYDVTGQRCIRSLPAGVAGLFCK
jgi:hypothetical protein